MTERGAAIDSFYVREVEGGKILPAAQLEHMVARLREEIGKLEAFA